MDDLETVSTELFNKIRSRFSDIKIGDKSGALTDEEKQARFFDVNYTVNGKPLGRVNIKLDDKTLTIIYNNSMLEKHGELTKQNWYDFLLSMRQFAKSNRKQFDTRDITKSNLNQRDYQYLSKESGELNMSESKLFGTSRTSFQNVGEARIVVKHSSPVNDANPAGRTHRIDSIYIESNSGERFRYPHRHLNGARAMARHVDNGGTVYDNIGEYISGLSEEVGKLRQFKQYTQRSTVMAEAMGEISEQVVERIGQIKLEIAALQRQQYYDTFKETFQPKEFSEIPENIMDEWVDALTIRSFNEELKSVFPYIYTLVKEKQDQGLSYDDLVIETDMQDDDDVDETSDVFSTFETNIEELSMPNFEQDHEEDDPPFDADDETPSDKDEFGNTIKHRAQHLARKGMRQAMPKEVVEFIASMYDRDTGTFPKGEEGVKISVEKKFGEQAGQFAGFVVEKLSAKSQGDAYQQSPDVDTGMDEGEVQGIIDNNEQSVSVSTNELMRIRQLSGF